MDKINTTKFIEKIFETNGDCCEWFGYYNYDTLNHDKTKMLCNHASFDAIKIERGMKIDIGYYDLKTGIWEKLGESDSFNWQQGAMAQWLPGDGNENKVIYNCSENNRLVAKIVDIESKIVKTINWPIYGITPDGKKSITLNFERSYWCRAYHYESVANPLYDVRVAEDDGIYEIDLDNNTCKRIITIQDVINMLPEANFGEQKHWLEHIMINRTGTKFVFLHRYSPSFDVYLYQTRICIADINGENLQVLSDEGKFNWSHFGWNNLDFVIYTIHNNKIGSLYKDFGKNTKQKVSIKQYIYKYIVCFKSIIPPSLRAILRGNNSYYQYYSLNGQNKYYLKDNINDDLFKIDGHPSFTNDGRYMITDTYPDKKKMQKLIVYDIITKKGIVLGEFYASLFKNPASCDLHPKLSGNDSYVVIDTAYSGVHSMIVYKLNWNEIKKSIS